MKLKFHENDQINTYFKVNIKEVNSSFEKIMVKN